MGVPLYNVFQSVAIKATVFFRGEGLKKPIMFIVFDYENGFFTFVTFEHFRFKYLIGLPSTI